MGSLVFDLAMLLFGGLGFNGGRAWKIDAVSLWKQR